MLSGAASSPSTDKTQSDEHVPLQRSNSKNAAADSVYSTPRSSVPSTPKSAVPSTPKSNRGLDLSLSSAPSTPAHDKSDTEFDMETNARLSNISHEDLLHLFKKQEKTLSRYKTRFSEVGVICLL